MGYNLENILQAGQKFNRLQDYYQKKTQGVVTGLEGSSLSLFISNLRQIIKDNILIITTTRAEADSFYGDLINLLGEKQVYLFPSLQVLPHEALEIEGDIKSSRLEVLNNLSSSKRKVYIAPITSLLQSLPNAKQYYNRIKVLKLEDSLDIDRLATDLIKMGYQRVKKVSERGQFSIRGGIVDIYPLIDKAIRIELFGDQIESIRYFNPRTQRSTKSITRFVLYPAIELVMPKDNLFVSKIEEDLAITARDITEASKQKLGKKVKQELEKLTEGVNFPEKRKYIKYFYEPDNFFAYFSGTVAFINPDRIKKRAYNYLKEIIDRYDDLLNKGKVLRGYKDLFIDFNDLFYDIKSYKIYFSTTNKNLTDFKLEFKEEINLMRPESFQGQIDLFIKQLKNLYQQGYKIVIALGSLSKAEKLKERLRDNNLPGIVVEKINNQIKKGNIVLTSMSLKQGVIDNKLKFVLYTEKELLKKQVANRKKRKKSFKQGAPISSFTDLNEGDYVVHENHGIAHYLGIETLEIQGKRRDYLLLLYDKDDKLYVPTDKVDLIQKYVALKDRDPKLNKLDGNSWQKAKARVKKSVEEMAEELLQLYAKRELEEGYQFGEDTVWQKEFEAAFPYQETEDQIKVIEQVKDDMELPQPMDRLICGDVGYGKTEVAIRAIFKAIMDGKQAAFLVPTTILAQQHFNNIRDRFEKYPIRVGMLSRFRTAREQKKVIEALQEGKVDLVIGTHRLLSQDINFKDLGLLVVDEEQRFGVKQKERLKKFKESIDVLTLSATPIPRTLHMSLVGVRDISLIETPPENRYPIRTFVGEYNEDLVKEAIYRELRRGGQVYFVHNRVKDIKKKAREIQGLFPEARIMTAHGQMNEKKLEKIMVDFLQGEYDILVCTTIIENGMDISNVNTIIINRADRMGLSQLYQLRGRVGRSNQIAYAYLLYEKDNILSEIAEKRLKAIKEFTSLGSGFKIAMRDLEIRGAGNILGPEQHGHIETVGFSLYCKLLEDAIDKLENKEQEEKLDCKLELNTNAYLPEDYIPDSKQKIELYKKIEQIKNDDDYKSLCEEMKDRFGPMPKEVELLLDIARAKVLASQLGFYEIKETGNVLNFKFNANYLESPTELMEVVSKFDNLKLVAKKAPEIKAEVVDYSDREKSDLIFDLLTSLKNKNLKEKTG